MKEEMTNSPIPVFDVNHPPIEFRELIDDVMENFEQGVPANSKRARDADLAVYTAWGKNVYGSYFKAIPSSPEHIEKFLNDMSVEVTETISTKNVNGEMVDTTIKHRLKALSTIERYLASLSYKNKLYLDAIMDITNNYQLSSGFVNPTSVRRVKATLQKVRALYRDSSQKQAQPFSLDLIEDVISLHDGSLRDKLEITLLSFAFDTMMRCSELVRVNVEDLSFDPTFSDGIVELHWSKTDQDGQGQTRYLSSQTVKLLKDYLQAANINSGRLFRSIGKNNKQLEAMHKDRVGIIFKRLGRRLSKFYSYNSANNILSKSKTVPKEISAHSTRVAAAQALALNGASTVQLMNEGGWKSAVMPARYSRHADTKKGAMAQLHKRARTT